MTFGRPFFVYFIFVLQFTFIYFAVLLIEGNRNQIINMLIIKIY